MKRFIGLVLLLAAIPICGYLSSWFVTAHYETQWTEAVERSAASDVDKLRNATPGALQSYCDSADEENRDACATYEHATLLRIASVVMLVAGFALLAAIFVAARLAARNRDLLLSIFAPGMRIVLIVLFALILAQGAIATYGVYLFEAVAIHAVHIFIIGGIGLGALVGAFSMLEAGLSISRRISQSVLGQAVTRDEEPELWALVESVAQRLGSLQPKNIVIGLEPNFYATSADVVVRPGQITHSDETLYLSLPLMRTLSREELTAVIGHELAHFRGEDTRFSLEFYPIYAGTARALEALHNESRAGARGLAMMPGIAILSFFIEQFATAERGLGRARELEADQAGASVSSPAALATALLKIGAFTRLWNPAVAEMIETLRDNQPVTNISSRYAELAALSGSTEIIEDVAAAKTAHPTDTHPPTGVRIEALGLSVAELDEIALNIDPHTSSIELLADPVALEEKLTEAARRLLVERGVVPALKLSQGNVDSAPAPTQAAEHAEA